MNALRILLFASLIVVGVMSRLIDRPWNLAPIGAIALFAGAHIRNRSLALCVPLLTMVVSDLAIGLLRGDVTFYAFHKETPVVYGSFLLYALLGMGVRLSWRKQAAWRPERARRSWTAQRFVPVFAAALSGAILFFLITNLGSWYHMYPRTVAGLIQCYEAGLPFFRNTLLSDVVFAAILFGGYELLKSVVPDIERSDLAHARQSG